MQELSDTKESVVHATHLPLLILSLLFTPFISLASLFLSPHNKSSTAPQMASLMVVMVDFYKVLMHICRLEAFKQIKFILMYLKWGFHHKSVRFLVVLLKLLSLKILMKETVKL